MRFHVVLVLAVAFTAGCVSSPRSESQGATTPVRVIEAAPVPSAASEAVPPSVLAFVPTHAAAVRASTARAASCPVTVDAVPTDTDDRRLRGEHVIVVAKSERRLWLYESGSLAGCWSIALGFDPVGDKAREGDGRTPEGWYRTSDKPWSAFDGAIAIHYPNRDDADRAVEQGTIGRRTRRRILEALREGKPPPQKTAMGGEVLIHGGGSRSDWTLGCVALTDADLAELRERLPRSKRADMLILR